MTDRQVRSLRVCLVSAAYRPYPSGVSEHVANLAQALSDLGHEVEVLTTGYGGAEAHESAPIPVTRLGRARMIPLNGSYATFPTGLGVPAGVQRFLAEGRFDIVHGHGVFWPEIAYWAIRHSRSVNVVTFLSSGFNLTSWGSTAYRVLFHRHLARIHGRIAISERARHTYAPYVAGPCRTIPSGVDTGRFRPGLAPLPASGGGRRVVFVGRLDRRKGLPVLLEALPEIRERMPDVGLVVVGSGPDEAAARRSVSRLGLDEAVAFEGRVPGAVLPRYYAGGDVYCSPALGGESFGIVLLEAMASGAAVVASDIPGYDETVRNGQDGLLAPPNDPASLADAVVRVLEDDELRARLTAAGLAKAQRHAWPRIAEQTARYYSELLDEAGGAGRR